MCVNNGEKSRTVNAQGLLGRNRYKAQGLVKVKTRGKCSSPSVALAHSFPISKTLAIIPHHGKNCFGFLSLIFRYMGSREKDSFFLKANIFLSLAYISSHVRFTWMAGGLKVKGVVFMLFNMKVNLRNSIFYGL